MTAWFEPLFKILWYSQLPCFDVKGVTSKFAGHRSLLKKCLWKGQKVACSAIFDTFPTDRGMCCAFNMDKAETIFKEGKYSNLTRTMQGMDKLRTFGLTRPPKWYRDQNEPKSTPGE